MGDLGVWTVDDDKPRAVPRSAQVDLEKHLEDWIEADPTLLPGDLKIIGRQVKLDGGTLDLLALDPPDRWVVVELKRGRPSRVALAQALDYTSSIAGMTSAELDSKVPSGLQAPTDEAALSQAIRKQLEAESEDNRRHVDVMIVGVGADPTLERIADYLSSFGVHITLVSFEFFAEEGGHRLLLREVEESSESPPTQPQHTLSAVRQRAVEAGVKKQFDRFVGMAEGAGLYVQPVTRSVRFKAPANRSYTLLFATPQHGGMSIGVRPKAITKFYPHLTERDVEQALPLSVDGTQLSAADLDSWLGRIEAFLERLQAPDDADREDDADDSE